MTDETMMWIILGGVALLVGMPIVYALLVKYKVLKPHTGRTEQLLAAGDEKALWKYRVSRLLKLGMFQLTLGLFATALKLIAASQAGSSLIMSSEMLLPLLLLASAILMLGMGAWQVSIGWEKAKAGIMGRSGRALIEKYHARAENPKKTAIS